MQDVGKLDDATLVDAVVRRDPRAAAELWDRFAGPVRAFLRRSLVDGEVDMDVNFALEDYEVARGFILACQSYPVTDKVVVDFDQTGTG
jgi:ring-1,2-phenylacetyl-CoA epoxidase subunit PaaE